MSPRTFLIAEAGVNHNGSLDLARRLVAEAAAAGADAVKFQTFRADRLVTRRAAKAPYQERTTGSGEGQREMLRRVELSDEDHARLCAACREAGIEFMSSPFDLESLALLATLGVQRLKVPSGEITNLPLLVAAGRQRADVIVSTGMATMAEIEEALGALAFGAHDPPEAPSRPAFRAAFRSAEGRRRLGERVTLLHCTSEYPTPPADVNLAAMAAMRRAFGLPVGYSDHTCGIAVSVAAVALGATVIEKHFTLDRSLPGPDHAASLEPSELRDLVRAVREVEQAVGDGEKRPAAGEAANRAAARKSLVAARPVRQGEAFTEENLALKRPGTGIPATEYYDYLGRAAARDYDVDEAIEP